MTDEHRPRDTGEQNQGEKPGSPGWSPWPDDIQDQQGQQGRQSWQGRQGQVQHQGQYGGHYPGQYGHPQPPPPNQQGQQGRQGRPGGPGAPDGPYAPPGPYGHPPGGYGAHQGPAYPPYGAAAGQQPAAHPQNPYGAAAQGYYGTPLGGGQATRNRRTLWIVLGISGACVLLLALVGVSLRSALSGDEPTTSPYEQEAFPLAEDAGKTNAFTKDELEAMLAKHARALKRKNKKLYLSIYNQQNEKLMERQRRKFDNLTEIRFSKATYVTKDTTGSLVDKFGQGVTAKIDVAFVHKIKGVDVAPATEWYRWTVKVKSKDSDPVVTKVGGSPRFDGSFVYYPAPWDVYDDLTVVRKPHVVILADKSTARTARRYAGVVERAAVANLRRWSRAGPDKGLTPPGFLVTLEDNRKRYGRLFGKSAESVPDSAGYSVGIGTAQGAEKKGIFAGSRIVMDVNSGYFQRGTSGVREIARHEMGHALVQPLLDNVGTGLLGREHELWVIEGFAEYMAFSERGPQASGKFPALRQYVRSGRFNGKLPGNKKVYTSDPLVTTAGYALGHTAIHYIATEFGAKKAFKLVALHYHHPNKLRAQIRQVTGLSKAEFERRWAAYVRRIAG